MIPFITIIEIPEKPFSMFLDLQKKYEWLLDPIEYPNGELLIEKFKKAVIDRALKTEEELTIHKVQDKVRSIKLNDL
jgi:hypothetical protein